MKHFKFSKLSFLKSPLFSLFNLLNLFIVCLYFIFITSCITSHVKMAPQKATPKIKSTFITAKNYYQKNQYNKSLNNLYYLTKNYPTFEYIDDAYILIGKIYYKQKKFKQAYQAFFQIENLDVLSKKIIEAKYWAIKSLEQLNLKDHILKDTKNLSFYLSQDSSGKKISEIYQIRFKFLLEDKEYLKILKEINSVLKIISDNSIYETFRLQALNIIENTLNYNQLNKVANNSDFKKLKIYALFKIGKYLYDESKFYLASKFFNEIIEDFPQNQITDQANNYLQQIKSLKEVDSYTIGLIVPLSGKHSQLAQKTLQGFQLGLDLINSNNEQKFKLAIIDSEVFSETAEKAVEQLVSSYNVIAICGSLLSKTSIPIAQKANIIQVPTVIFSQKLNITSIGDYIFQNALTSKMQIEKLVNTVISKMNLKKIAIIYPNDPYGIEYANVFWDEVLINNGAIRGAQIYNPKETDFRHHIQRLAGTYYIEDRIKEYKWHLKQWAEKQSSRKKLKETPPDDLLPPIIDFDAIFIPDGIKTLTQIAPMLKYNEVKNITLLGTNLWNSPLLIERGEEFNDSTIFVDFLYNQEHLKNSSFYQKYKNTFHQSPTIFSLQAYDTALILKHLIMQGYTTREDLKNALQNLKQFNGAIGPLQINNKNEFIRPLSVLTVKKGKIVSF